MLADAVVLEIGASIFLAGAAIVGGCILLGLWLAGNMIRKSVDDLGQRLQAADQQHQKAHEKQADGINDIRTQLAIISGRN